MATTTNRSKRYVALGSTNSKLLRTGDGQLNRVVVANVSAEARYLKFYDKATAPTVGTDEPLVTIGIGKESTLALELELPYSLGIGLGITKTAPDNSTEAITAGDVLVTALLV